MIVVLIVIWPLAVESNRCGHLEEAVTQELQTLVVLSHTPLDMNLLLSMLLGIVRVFGKGFQSVFQPEIKI
jgi:hypothetical protein